jgi:hypothetical protein
MRGGGDDDEDDDDDDDNDDDDDDDDDVVGCESASMPNGKPQTSIACEDVGAWSFRVASTWRGDGADAAAAVDKESAGGSASSAGGSRCGFTKRCNACGEHIADASCSRLALLTSPLTAGRVSGYGS